MSNEADPSRKALDQAMEALGQLFAHQVSAMGPDRGRYAYQLLQQGGKCGFKSSFHR